MYLCYIDESGTSSIPGNTSHFVLSGIAIPVWKWKTCDQEIRQLKAAYGLQDAEIHTAWMRRRYVEQSTVARFESLDHEQRRYQATKIRKAELLRLQNAGSQKR